MMHETLLNPFAIATPDQMARVDALTVQYGDTLEALISRAGACVARLCAKMTPWGSKILVLCGPGNNGADGLTAAKQLLEEGFDVQVVFADDAQQRNLFLSKADLPPSAILKNLSQNIMSESSLIIDALFGTGLNKPLLGDGAKWARWLKESPIPTLSIDIPSGICGATGHPLGEHFHANATLTFERLKPAHVLYPSKVFCGEVFCQNIGLARDALASVPANTFINTPELWQKYLPPSDPMAHKYTRGSVGVIGGEKYSTGASHLSALAAQACGAGRTVLFCTSKAADIYANKLQAVILHPLARKGDITNDLKQTKCNAVVVGPGNGVNQQTKQNVQNILKSSCAVVIDADALSVFNEDIEELASLCEKRVFPTLITPHEGEFQKLFARVAHITNQTSKLEKARKAAQFLNATVVYKGADSVVASPQGKASVLINASPLLATAGSGDILAGAIASFLAQGMPSFEGANAAVWFHAQAANFSQNTFSAEDLPAQLSKALHDFKICN